MTTVLILNLDGESAIHSTWIIDQDLTQDQVDEAFPGISIWQKYPELDPEDAKTTDDTVILAALKAHRWTGRRVKYREGLI